MLKRLRLKFVLINMSIVTLMLCVILALVYYFTSANLENESIDMLRAVALNPPRPAPSEAAEDVRLPFFTLQISPGGEVLDVYGGYYDLSDADLLEYLAAQAASSPGSLGVIDAYNLRYYRADVPGNNLLVFADITSERATLDGLLRTCIIIGVAGFAVFLWISIALSRWAVRPVERGWEQQRQFVASASHELKTPLTVIMTNAELLSASGSGGRQTESILMMSRRMRSLIEQLLTLARADNDGEAGPMESVDFSGLVYGEALEMEPVCFERSLRLSTGIDGGISVHGDAGRLRELAGILLDNAAKYARPGGLITVSLRRSGRRKCLLTVSDEGEEIPPDELRAIFRRFYRSPCARKAAEGFGLGLSIAESIAHKHRGRIWAESSDGVNSFMVELPALD